MARHAEETADLIERDLAVEAREAAGIKKWPADGLRHSWVRKPSRIP